MPRALIIGSGPAAAGVALALSERDDLEITVIDAGTRLEADRASVRARLAASPAERWGADDLALIAAPPMPSAARGLPEKRSYGSNYPFRDVGQLDGLSTFGDVHRSVISSAYGGFSNIWGTQLMPFSEHTLAAWPVGLAELTPHYRAVLDEVPFAGEKDDLEERFPLIGSPRPLPPLSSRSERVLRAYERHRAALNGFGVTLGRARLAFQSDRCVLCGLCMSGCPYELLYSAAQTFDALSSRGRITYHGGLLAVRVEEHEGTVTVHARELESGRRASFQADRVYLACGALGTTRLVLGSLDRYGEDIAVDESVQFMLPMVSLRPVRDPREEPQFTLNQFNMVLQLGDQARDLSQLHFYTWDPAFLSALPPALLAFDKGAPLVREILRRTSVALGYLPSWYSPRLKVRAAPAGDDGLTGLEIRREDPHWGRNRALRTALAKVARAGRLLDLYPVLPKLVIAAGGKSYHYGASFPHRAEHAPARFASSDRLGRVGAWDRVHLVDASVFPDVPATTFTFTIMANAHRIASESLQAPW